MSKSDSYDYSRINLEDDPEEIYLKIIRAKTDSYGSIKYNENGLETKNLINIYSILTNKSIKYIEEEFTGKNIKEFKEELS